MADPDENKDRIDLNGYHRQQSERLVKEVSEQPLLSPEASIQNRCLSRKQATSWGS